MKKAVQLILISLFVFLQGFALEPAQIQPSSKSLHSTEVTDSNPEKSVSNLTSQTEVFIAVDDSSSPFTLKESNNGGWSFLPTFDTLLKTKNIQYLNYSKWLVIYFNIKVIIFPFHYHW